MVEDLRLYDRDWIGGLKGSLWRREPFEDGCGC